MNPKEKANKLVNDMVDAMSSYNPSMMLIDAWKVSVKCALITVDEIKKECNGMVIDWWEEVENELKKMI